MYRVATFCIILACPALLFPQAGPDTVAAPAAIPAPDTGAPAESKNSSGLTDSVIYGADTIRFILAQDLIRLQGNARIKYQGTELTAYQILFDTKTRTVEAAGIKKSTGLDTQWVETPVLVDKGERIEGFKMKYNLESRKGKVDIGNTEFENGYYTGRKVAMVSPKVLNARDGKFTTCDFYTDPHFHFASRRMKLYVNDKLIIKPVILKLQEIPVMALPFFVFPVKKERHSGLLIPRYGQDNLYGRYVKNVGYYYAPNPYWDAKASLEFYTKSRTRLNLAANFARRYLLDGGFHGSYMQTGNKNQHQRWDAGFSYNHTLSPRWTLRGSGTFTSDRNYFQDFMETIEERSQKDLRSNLYLTRRGDNNSFSVALDHNKTFLDQATTTTLKLPTINYSISGNVVPHKRKPDVKDAKEHWYHRLRFSYNTGFKNSLDKTVDTSVVKDTLEYHNTVDLSQNARLTYSGNILPWLSFGPAFSYAEYFNYKDRTDTSYIQRCHREDTTYQTGTYTSSVSLTAQQDIYGLFPVNRWSVEAFRHVLHPSLSYAYSYGYDLHRYNEGYLTFTPGSDKTLTRNNGINLGLTNLWQTKLKLKDQEKKLNLLTGPNFSTSYDLMTKKFGNISTHMHTSIKSINLNLDYTHSLYDESGDTLLLSNPEPAKRRFAREISRTFSVSTGYSTNKNAVYWDDIRRYSQKDDFRLTDQVVSTTTRSNSARVNYSISFTKGMDHPTQNLSGGFTFYPTKNWQIDYSGVYDLKLYDFVSQTITIIRDMHCWEARLVWHPTGYRQDLYIKIFIKEIPEVKVERTVRY